MSASLFSSERTPRLGVLILALVVTLFLGKIAKPEHGVGAGQSFLFLEAPFTQEVFGLSNHFMGGVAFAPDGDPWVNDCQFGGSELHRYDRQGVAPPQNGTNLHPESVVPSNAGCGMTNHQDGFIYSNTGSGAVQIDAGTGSPTGVVLGPPGNALGIAPDPQNGDVVYVAENCRFTGSCDIITVDPTSGSASVFVSLPGVQFVDGIFFNPSGSQLFLAQRSPFFSVKVVDRDAPGARTGTFNRDIPIASEPDGISFHSTGFVVTANTDGTMTKIIPGPDTVTLFASGGGRSDLSQVGFDGCVYVTQDFFTRFDDGATSGQSSLVRVCPDFLPPPGVGPSLKIDLKPGSNPNCVNDGNHGVTSVAIFGTEDVDALELDPTTAVFGGAEALRCVIGDIGMEGPIAGQFMPPDGIPDLVCKFRVADVTWPEPGSDCGPVRLEITTFDGAVLSGVDVACRSGEESCEAGEPLPLP